jgi:ActR/RegA family two-component response regulator
VARLKSLAPLRPSRNRWPETASRFRAERRRRRTRVVGFTGLAAAASIVLALSLGHVSRPTPANAEQLSQAMERSQALESALHAYNPEGRVLDGRTAGIAQELEDRIARVDRELEVAELSQQARDEELLKLWRERVGLLDALVDVHVTRASNAGL